MTESSRDIRKHKRLKPLPTLLLLFIIVFFMAVLPLCETTIHQIYAELKQMYILQSNNSNNTDFTIDISHINSKNALLMRLKDEKIIAEHNSDSFIYPASMTKIMTAILAIEKLTDLDFPIKLTSDLFEKLYLQNASIAGFEAGESVTVRDLLYGVLLPSGAECCLCLAAEISGSEEKFVQLMNEKATELGMAHTYFCNSTGLHNDRHKTTTSDMAILLSYALKDEYFRAIFTSSRHTTAASTIHPNGFTLTSTLFKNIKETTVIGGQLLGGKTGYTKQAGLCLASLATIDNTDYILITAGAADDHKTEHGHIEDAFNIFNQLGQQIEH